MFSLNFTLIPFMWRIYKLGRLYFRNSFCDWHLQLGHPSSQATTYILNHFQLSLISNTKLSFCTTCSQAKVHALSHTSLSFMFSCSFWFTIFGCIWTISCLVYEWVPILSVCYWWPLKICLVVFPSIQSWCF